MNEMMKKTIIASIKMIFSYLAIWSQTRSVLSLFAINDLVSVQLHHNLQ